MPRSSAAAPPDKPRASGRVRLWGDARGQLLAIRLDSIIGLQPSIASRDERLDVAASADVALDLWDPAALETMMLAVPPWVFERGPAGAKEHLLLAGGQLLPALRRLLPPDTLVPALVIDSKFQPPRLLQIAAAHAAALAAAAAALSTDSLFRILDDAAEHGASVVKPPEASAAYRRALGLRATAK